MPFVTSLGLGWVDNDRLSQLVVADFQANTGSSLQMPVTVILAADRLLHALGSLPRSKACALSPGPPCGKIFQKRIVTAFNILGAESLETASPIFSG